MEDEEAAILLKALIQNKIKCFEFILYCYIFTHMTCQLPRFPPKVVVIPSNVNDPSDHPTRLYVSSDDGRIYTECKECNGRVCMRGPEAVWPVETGKNETKVYLQSRL